jgi:hypothetical protein
VDNVLTPLQALVALLGECEFSLDFRPKFRAAMANAHCAIANAPLTAALALHGQVDLGKPIETPDAAITFVELQERGWFA